MEVLVFLWQCMLTTTQGFIGFVFFVALFWILIKLFRPSARFPRPVVYRTKIGRDHTSW